MGLGEMQFGPEFEKGVERIVNECIEDLVFYALPFWEKNNPEHAELEKRYGELFEEVVKRLSKEERHMLDELLGIKSEIEIKRYAMILFLGMKLAVG